MYPADALVFQESVSLGTFEISLNILSLSNMNICHRNITYCEACTAVAGCTPVPFRAHMKYLSVSLDILLLSSSTITTGLKL